MTGATTFPVFVNGAPRELNADSTVSDLIETLKLRRDLVAVEVNREIVRKASFDTRKLQAGDKIEIVEFVGGG